MTPQQIQDFLLNINQIPVDKIYATIISGYVTMENCREYELEHTKQHELQNLLQEYNKVQEVWTECVNMYTQHCANWTYDNLILCRNDFNRYIAQYKHLGHNIDKAVAYIRELEAEIEEEKREKKERIINQIIHDPIAYGNRHALEALFMEGIVTKQDLFDYKVITPKGLSVIMGRPDPQPQEWDVPPLPENFQDVYFFGVPRSGKSCVLGGLLHQATQKGIRKPLPQLCPEGNFYMSELIGNIGDGYVAPPTNEDSVNFIPLELRDPSKKWHKVSFIEMSGEYFNQTFHGGIVAKKDGVLKSVNTRGYLRNKNKKVIFFIIDYSRKGSNVEIIDKRTGNTRFVSQEDIFDTVLGHLRNDADQANSILQHTLSIQVIVTKCDLMPVPPEQRLQCAKKYLKQEFPSFMNNLADVVKIRKMNARYNYNLVYHTFTLADGDMMLGKVFDFDPTDSNKILEALIEQTLPIPRQALL